MNIQIIEDKLNLIKSEGKNLIRKQIGYFENNYDPIEGLENLTYYWSENELILLGQSETIGDFEAIAGYGFDIDSASLFVKLGEESLMVINDKDDIEFFRDVVVLIIHNSEIDEEGNYNLEE